MEHVGKRIKEIRESKGLTQKELADLYGTQQGVISQFERSKSLTTTTIEKLAKVLDVSVESIVEEKARKRIGKHIRDIRIEKGMTQKELAEKMNTKQSFISRVEKNSDKKTLNQTSITKFAEALDCDISDLFFGEHGNQYRNNSNVLKGFEVIHILKNFDGRVTRNTLVEQLKTSDREVRRIIEYINNDNTEEFKDILIVSTSDEPGYKLAETEEEVMAYQREIESRIAALNMKLPKIHYFKEVFRSACQ